MFCDSAAILRCGEVALQGKLDELTRGGGRLLVAAGVQESVFASLEKRTLSAVRNNGFFEFQFAELDSANQAIDLLRESGARIERLDRCRSTLEDVFIRTVEEAKQ